MPVSRAGMHTRQKAGKERTTRAWSVSLSRQLRLRARRRVVELRVLIELSSACDFIEGRQENNDVVE